MNGLRGLDREPRRNDATACKILTFASCCPDIAPRFGVKYYIWCRHPYLRLRVLRPFFLSRRVPPAILRFCSVKASARCCIRGAFAVPRTSFDVLKVRSFFMVPLSFPMCVSGSVPLLPNAVRSFSPDAMTFLRIPANILNEGGGGGAAAAGTKFSAFLASSSGTSKSSCIGCIGPFLIIIG